MRGRVGAGSASALFFQRLAVAVLSFGVTISLRNPCCLWPFLLLHGVFLLKYCALLAWGFLAGFLDRPSWRRKLQRGWLLLVTTSLLFAIGVGFNSYDLLYNLNYQNKFIMTNGRSMFDSNWVYKLSRLISLYQYLECDSNYASLSLARTTLQHNIAQYTL